MDPFDAPEFKAFAKQVLRDAVPKIAASSHFIAIAPDGGIGDVKMALEIGFAILMDKPLVVLKQAGRTTGEKLLRIADQVIEVDFETEAGREASIAKITAALQQ